MADHHHAAAENAQHLPRTADTAGVKALRLVAILTVLATACSSDGGAFTSQPPEGTAPAPPSTTAPATTSSNTSSPTITSIPSAPTAPAATTSTTAPTTTTPPPPTVATTVTSTTAPTTTAAPGPAFTPGVPSLFPPDPLPGSGGASGSGCTPGAGDLPDGIWFGYARQLTGDGIAFDLACFFFGDAAYVQGDADGVEVTDDYYVRNANPTLRTVSVAAATLVHHIDASGELGFVPLQFGEWPPAGFSYIPCPGDFCGIWLYINGGAVTEIVEQYVP